LAETLVFLPGEGLAMRYFYNIQAKCCFREAAEIARFSAILSVKTGHMTNIVAGDRGGAARSSWAIQHRFL
jgi:hypothetical protein